MIINIFILHTHKSLEVALGEFLQRSWKKDLHRLWNHFDSLQVSTHPTNWLQEVGTWYCFLPGNVPQTLMVPKSFSYQASVCCVCLSSFPFFFFYDFFFPKSHISTQLEWKWRDFVSTGSPAGISSLCLCCSWWRYLLPGSAVSLSVCLELGFCATALHLALAALLFPLLLLFSPSLFMLSRLNH